MLSDSEIAYAKINLALHVRRRRDDGYHELESLVAFLDRGDVVSVKAADGDRFTSDGEYAATIGSADDNLVLKALGFARGISTSPIPAMHVHLEKNLPVAAGLGGGSADAAAMLRILQAQGFPLSDEQYGTTAHALGADVPACLYSSPLIMAGIGERITLLNDNSLAGIFAVLVNPNIAVSTGPVFKAWDGVDRGALPDGSALDIAKAGRNDLQTAAIGICPQIADVLAMLDKTSPLVARMSGSGASCFALYDDSDKAAAAAQVIRAAQPGWWVMDGGLTQ